MKSRETKQKDLVALTESLQNSKSAMVVSFSKLTVTKDQELRHNLREAGAKYQVVKNTLARIAVKGTEFENVSEYFKGVTAIAWTDNDPVVLTKTISKFLKDNSEVYNFKTGVLEGKVIDFAQLQSIANLPSKEELISKLLWVLNSSAERLVSVINAVPRDLAVVIKQIGDQKEGEAPAKAELAAAEPAAEVKAEEAAPAVTEEAAAAEEGAAEAPVVEAQAETGDEPAADAAVETALADDAAEAAEVVAESTSDTVDATAEAAPEAEAAAPDAAEVADESSDDILEIPAETEGGDKAE